MTRERRFELLRARAQANGVLAERELQHADLLALQALADESEVVGQRITANHEMALFLASTGEIAEAAKVTRSGLSLAIAEELGAWIAALQTELARILRISSDFAEAESLLIHAQRYYEQNNNLSGYAFTTDKLGGLAWATGRFCEAIALHQKAADIFGAAGDQYRASMALNNLGSAHWSNGNYTAARKSLQQALQINKTIGHRRGEADNLDNIGGLYWVEADYDAAIDYYQKALAIRRAIDDRWGISISTGNLGGTYRLQERYELALEALDEALEINRAMSRQLGIGYNQLSRAYSLMGLKKYRAAREAFTESAQIWQELDRKGQLIETACGQLHLALAEDDEQAVRSAIKSVQAHLSAELRPMMLAQLHHALYLAFLAQGNTEYGDKGIGIRLSSCTSRRARVIE